MEGQPSPSEHPLAPSEFDGHDGLQQLDENDELLLLQMPDFNEHPVSPSLKAVLDKGDDVNLLEPPKFPAAPLVVERPRSSGLNTEDFCFTKPLQYGKKPSFVGPPKQTPPKPVSHNDTPAQNIRDTATSPNIGESGTQPPPGNEQDSRHSPEFNEGSHSTVEPNSQADAERQRPETVSAGAEHTTNPPSGPGTQLSHPQSTSSCKPQPTLNEQYGSPKGNTATHEAHFKPRVNSRNQNPLMDGKRKAPRTHSSSQPDSCIGLATDSSSVAYRSCAPSSEGFRVEKHRRKQNSRKPTVSQSRSLLPGDSSSSQLTEDDIFLLLINRLRQREENEIAAASQREQVETEVLNLKEENKALKDQLESSVSRLQKKNVEIKAHKTQMEHWKAKLNKFKFFLNDFGNDYQGLRDEASHLKSTKGSLDNDRRDILNTINDARSQVARVVQSVENRKGRLAETSNVISSLEQALKNSDEKTVSVHRQLSDEKRKVAVLESYIQNLTRCQGKSIASIREEQHEILRRLDSAFESVDRKWESSHIAIQEMISPTLDTFSSSAKDLHERCSTDKLEAQQVTDHILTLMARMDSFGAHMTKEIEKSSQMSNSVAEDLKERLEVVKGALGSDSLLCEQLVTTQRSCGNLDEQLGSVGPSFGNLAVLIEALQGRELGLVNQMDEFSSRISELQHRTHDEPSKREVTDRSAEISALQCRLQEKSAELNLAQERLKIAEAENETVKTSMSESAAEAQRTESQVSRLRAENSELQEKLQSVELKIREELNRASVISRDQNKARFEQQLHELLREKADLKRDTEKLKEQLEKTRKSHAENDVDAKSEKSEREKLQASVLAKEKEVQSLQDAQTDLSGKLAARDADIRKYQILEESISTQQSRFHEKLDQASKRIDKLGHELSLKNEKGDTESNENLQKSVELLQEQLKKEEFTSAVYKEELSAANSAKSSLESGKAKAKAEIHGLLRRVQESEKWMKSIRSTLEKLGIRTAKEPFQEIWVKLETLIRAANRSSSRPGSSAQRNNFSTPRVSKTRRGNVADLTPRRLNTTPSQVLQTTEFIYRAQSVRSGGHSSPEREVPGPSVGANNKTEPVPGSQPTTDIVPFSNIRKQLSPEHTLSPSEDLGELAGILLETSEKAEHTTPPNHSLPYPEKNNTEAEEGAADKNSEQAGVKRKAVTFQSQELSGSREEGATAEENDDISKNSTPKKFVGDKETRQIRRTYSRNRQCGSMGEEIKAPLNASSSGLNSVGRRIAESPCSRDSKRARVSAGSARRQTSGVSEYFEREASPADSNLALGCKNSATRGNFQAPRKTRGQKRGGRKSRGERYDARFNQDT